MEDPGNRLLETLFCLPRKLLIVMFDSLEVNQRHRRLKVCVSSRQKVSEVFLSCLGFAHGRFLLEGHKGVVADRQLNTKVNQHQMSCVMQTVWEARFVIFARRNFTNLL